MATVAGDVVDRPPMSFWGHFYDREESARDLAAATIAFRALHDWDFIKLNPRASYHGEGWGLSYTWDRDPLHKPVRMSYPVHGASDLSRVRACPATRARSASSSRRSSWSARPFPTTCS
jgi:uroporphyrinogen decarboxylase